MLIKHPAHPSSIFSILVIKYSVFFIIKHLFWDLGPLRLRSVHSVLLTLVSLLK